MIGFYNYTVILTYLSLASALVGVTFSVHGNIQAALICLFVSGFCDMFDGSVARTKKNRTEDEKAFGMNIDSLCDLVAFGVQPAMLLYGYFRENTPIYVYAVMIFFVLAAVSRLAFFDVQEAKMKKEGAGERKDFLGLPVTNSAIFLPGLMTVALPFDISYGYVCLAGILAIGIAFITPFKMKKLYMPWLLIPAVIGAAFFCILIIFGGRLNA